jgi:predicted nucleic acid-binding protein
LRLFLRDADKQYEVVPLNSGIIRAAIGLTQRHKLRGYDAVHLATALAVNTELLQKQLPPLTFVSADEDLLDAAEAEGLPTENPNLYV